MSKMKVWEFEQYGPPSALKLQEREMLQPGPGEVLVKVAATALNPSDVKNVSGHQVHLAARAGARLCGHDRGRRRTARGRGLGQRPGLRCGARRGACRVFRYALELGQSQAAAAEHGAGRSHRRALSGRLVRTGHRREKELSINEPTVLPPMRQNPSGDPLFYSNLG